MKSIVSKLILPIGFAATLPASAKLAAWYPLDDSASSAAMTASENVAGNAATVVGLDADLSLTAVVQGHPSASQGLGTSYLLNEGNIGGALSLGTGAAVQPTDQFTLSCFFQPGASPSNPYDRLFESLDGNAAGLNGIRIDLGASGDQVRFLVRDGSGSTSQASNPQVLKNDGTWYFCAFRYDSTSADAPLRVTVLELDGSAIDDAAIAAATNGPATVATGALSATHSIAPVIGSSSAAGGPFSLSGALDELAIYDNSDANGVLSDADLALNAQFGPSGVELITDFTSSTLSVTPGNPATFSWTITEPFDSLTLDDGNGNVTDLAPLTSAGSGSTNVTPAVTTTYYLKGVNGEIENTHAIKILSGAAPEISSFTSSSAVVSTGGTVDLNWTVIGANSITLDPGALDVSALTMTTVTVSADTTYTLSATNNFGTTTAMVSISVFDGLVPTHRYAAGVETNSDGTWIDNIAGKNFNTTGVTRFAPLDSPSPNTSIAGAYVSAPDAGVVGGAVAAFQFAQSSFEIWLRPGDLNADHGVIFETGGGQNGISALLNQDGLRFLGSSGDTRNLDLVVPVTGLNLDDFIQVVFSHDTTSDAFSVSVRDTFGTVLTDTATASIVMGGNAATVFAWGAGTPGGSETGLGGRTDGGPSPDGLTSFVGEIGIINIYDSILDATQIQAAFDSVATVTTPPAGGQNAITSIDYDGASAVTLTWNSQSGKNYDAEFSIDLENWAAFSDPVQATDVTTTKTFTIPPNRPKFFLRIIEVAAP